MPTTGSRQVFFDAQCGPIAPAQAAIVELLAKVLTGSVVVWFSVQELVDEYRKYRSVRRQYVAAQDGRVHA